MFGNRSTRLSGARGPFHPRPLGSVSLGAANMANAVRRKGPEGSVAIRFTGHNMLGVLFLVPVLGPVLFLTAQCINYNWIAVLINPMRGPQQFPPFAQKLIDLL